MVLPNFLIIGAQKAATTWLAACLDEHPDAFIPQAKELYFFNVSFDKGLAWYESRFSNYQGEKAVGEATPGYISHPEAAGRIRAVLGDVRLIASLRHPVDRAYSAFWHYMRAGKIKPDADFVSLFRDQDAFEIRSRGYYAPQLARYIELFGRESLMVLIYEEAFGGDQQAVSDSLRFIGVDSDFRPQALTERLNSGGADVGFLNTHARRLQGRLRRLVHSNAVPPAWRTFFSRVGSRVFERMVLGWGPKTRRYEPLDRNLRQELFLEYRASVDQLEALLQRDLSIWYQDKRS